MSSSDGVLPGLTKDVLSTWDWLTGKKPEPTQDASEPIIDEEDSSSSESEPVVHPSIPIRRGSSLEEEQYLLRVESLPVFEERVKDPYRKVKEARKKIDPLDDLLQEITTNQDSKGNLKATSPEIKALIKEAQALGVKVPKDKEKDKENYTKSDVDTLTNNIRIVTSRLQTEMNMNLNYANQAMSEHNTLMAELNKMEKDRKELGQAICRNIAGK